MWSTGQYEFSIPKPNNSTSFSQQWRKTSAAVGWRWRKKRLISSRTHGPTRDHQIKTAPGGHVWRWWSYDLERTISYRVALLKNFVLMANGSILFCMLQNCIIWYGVGIALRST
ncbi:hypothetical protein TorRG33x02_095010 [Trema orientale]|uniref:Uncharacterized protein n=1 Tax=Trema orientale TaxID=63057 RepID=A0A2P5FAA3_TREOI|nr:hypothetical protein TorRG33x02_095010 [Trema orientale]